MYSEKKCGIIELVFNYEQKPHPNNNKADSSQLEDIGAWERKSYYERLGVLDTASKEEIKKAFRRASMAYHPDTVEDHQGDLKSKYTEIQKLVNEAYAILSNGSEREKYDKSRTNTKVENDLEGAIVDECTALVRKNIFKYAEVANIVDDYVRRGSSKEKLLNAIWPSVAIWIVEDAKMHSKYSPYQVVDRTLEVIKTYLNLGFEKHKLLSITENSIIEGFNAHVSSRITGGIFAFPYLKKDLLDCEKLGFSRDKLLSKTEHIFLDYLAKLISGNIGVVDKDRQKELDETVNNYLSIGIDREKMMKFIHSS